MDSQDPTAVQLLRIKLTLHRMFTLATAVVFLIARDVTSGMGQSMASLHLDWVGGVIAVFFVVGEWYSGVTPAVCEYWLHVDRSSLIRAVGRVVLVAIVLALHVIITYGVHGLAVYLTDHEVTPALMLLSDLGWCLISAFALFICRMFLRFSVPSWLPNFLANILRLSAKSFVIGCGPLFIILLCQPEVEFEDSMTSIFFVILSVGAGLNSVLRALEHIVDNNPPIGPWLQTLNFPIALLFALVCFVLSICMVVTYQSILERDLAIGTLAALVLLIWPVWTVRPAPSKYGAKSSEEGSQTV
ncbi:hypothetical protein MVEN_02188900 [Mycena venus]|uniref:Uncharacterized protein n=1 Tax=Mycena venus TaxID=2733690 RepID=A0A8H7CHR2_9AGAR|nr:hypothetical protein MVEN_02188900 [Mycena venus]